MTISELSSLTHLLPVEIKRELPDPLVPWTISKPLFERMRETDPTLRYRKVEVFPTDPDWRFPWIYFNFFDKPHQYGIRRIYCLHERHLQQAFEAHLSVQERDASKFLPNWDQEPRADQRAVVMQRFKQGAQVFSPFRSIENDGRQRNWSQTKLFPLWHGSREDVCDSIAESGFTFFGKVSLSTTNSDPQSTDEGFFGSGIYFTNSARYAADIYSRGHLILAWVSMREPFPVVGDPQQEDMKVLQGKGHYKHYNAHYIPVRSANPHDLYESVYHPCQKGEVPHCDEFVVFDRAQTLPRFWIELEVEGLYLLTPAEVPLLIKELIPHVLKTLAQRAVDRDEKLRLYLAKELATLVQMAEDDYLEDHGDKYKTLYTQLTQRLGVALQF